MTKKPKSFNVWKSTDDWGCEVWRQAGFGARANGKLIPSGADMPLPADVRRVLLSVSVDREFMSDDAPTAKAWDAHLRAEKRRKAGKK